MPSLPVMGLARGAWVATAAAALALFLIGVPARFREAHHACATCLIRPQQLDQVSAAGLPLDLFAALVAGVAAIMGLIWIGTGIIVFLRRGHDVMALFAAFYLVTFPTAFTGIAEDAFPSWRLLSGFVTFASSVTSVLFWYLFPDGRFAPRWIRWAFVLSVVYFGLRSFYPGGAFNPLERWPVLNAAVFVALLASLVGAQMYRYLRVSTTLQRQQTKWVVFGLSVALSGFLVSMGILIGMLGNHPSLLTTVAGAPIVYGFVNLIPLAIGVAMVRSRLWDIDLVLNRALVYGGLSLTLAAVYVLLVAGAGALLNGRASLMISLLGAGVVAVLLQPLRELLQRAANRLIYGDRDQPYAALSSLSRRLEGTLAPDAVLRAIVDTVAESLRLPYVAIELPGISVSRGVLMSDVRRWPLLDDEERLGELVVGARAGERMTADEARLIGDLARQAGVAVRAVRLNAALRKARDELVIAREEERRRVRRDLHDGLGATLGAIVLKAGSARHELERDREAGAVLLGEIEDDARAAIADIRRLIYDLRPTVLDQRGLPAALQDLALQHAPPANGSELRVRVECPPALPPLPAAVELAVYRIAQEALTNVRRHSHARICKVRLAVDDELELVVSDDGDGFALGAPPGLGLASMRERAEEVGGRCEIAPAPSGGVMVRARLPARLAVTRP